jgi:hypothetical protein
MHRSDITRLLPRILDAPVLGSSPRLRKLHYYSDSRQDPEPERRNETPQARIVVVVFPYSVLSLAHARCAG